MKLFTLGLEVGLVLLWQAAVLDRGFPGYSRDPSRAPGWPLQLGRTTVRDPSTKYCESLLGGLRQ